MKRLTKHLIYLIPALLVILLPSSVLAWSYSVSPAVKEINNVSPGGEAEFNLIIHNKDNTSHTFMLTTYNPEESERRQGKAEFPDSSWVSFSTQELQVAANSESEVTVTVVIPAEQEWVDKDWEIWLSIMPADGDLLVVNYYVRLLVSTGGGVENGSNVGLIVGAVAGMIVIVGLITWEARRKKKPK
jgi:hypothetical protein